MKKRILYVDNIGEAAESRKDLLQNEGYAVCLYKNGLDAIEDINNGREYDLAIVDIELGDVGGDEVVDASLRKNPNIPVFSMSCWPWILDGCKRHIVKPTSHDELVRTLDDYFLYS